MKKPEKYFFFCSYKETAFGPESHVVRVLKLGYRRQCRIGKNVYKDGFIPGQQKRWMNKVFMLLSKYDKFAYSLLMVPRQTDFSMVSVPWMPGGQW